MSKDKRWIPLRNNQGVLCEKADAETDFFVFGYACKIFRDDEKALEMDQGKHLIPWIGDQTLKIDRYDARGYLNEISQFDGTNKDYDLTPEEIKIEQLCDEERYRALHHNEEEKDMYQEEELKRLKQNLSSNKEYGQVAYQYDAEEPYTSKAETKIDMEDGGRFVPSPSLYIPANVKLPSTVKENQIIEKTASHIASHGPQVEIIIKTRQANNQKLNFLHVGSPLNPYYNFILSQIKMGCYKPACMTQQESERRPIQENEQYLHPSLPAPAPSTVESAPSIPSIAYMPSPDCSYNMLVNKIRNVQQSQGQGEAEREEPYISGDNIPYNCKRRKMHSAQSPMTSVGLPPEHVKEIISRLINFAHSRDLHPSEISTHLLKQDSKNLGFLEPGHKYHNYYVQQLQENCKENMHNKPNHSVETTNNDEASTSTSLGPYDLMEEKLNQSASKKTDLPQESSEAVMRLVENYNSVATNDDNIPNPPSKPALVCFSIKKNSQKTRMATICDFPLEETSSEEEGQ